MPAHEINSAPTVAGGAIIGAHMDRHSQTAERLLADQPIPCPCPQKYRDLNFHPCPLSLVPCPLHEVFCEKIQRRDADAAADQDRVTHRSSGDERRAQGTDQIERLADGDGME